MAFQHEIKVNSFAFTTSNSKTSYVEVARADVVIPDLRLALNGVRMTWSEVEGFLVRPPYAAIRGGRPALMWRHNSPLGRALCDTLLDHYEAMGGENPPHFRERLSNIIEEAIAK